jgi:gliding motility-associated-like protein
MKQILFVIALIFTLNASSQIYVPNAFTPNNDGINDYIQIQTNDTLDIFQFTLYNSWGEEIWYTENIDDKWDGGDEYYSPDGAYSYLLRYRVQEYGYIQHVRGYIIAIK